MALSRQKEARSRVYALLLFRMTSRVLYSAQYHRQHCTLHAFEQFGALYMHNHDDKYPSRPGFEPDTPRLQAPVDTNEPSGPANNQIMNYSTNVYVSQITEVSEELIQRVARDSNLVPPGYKPQSIRMSHRGRPITR